MFELEMLRIKQNTRRFEIGSEFCNGIGLISIVNKIVNTSVSNKMASNSSYKAHVFDKVATQHFG